MKLNTLIIMIIFSILSACSKEPAETTTERVDRIAVEFVDAYYAHYPEEAFESGYPDAPSDRLGDRSAASRAAWDHKVDQWLQQLDGIDPSALNGTPSAVTFLFALDRLQAIQDQRVCRTELWNISPTWTGWQTTVVDTLAAQPVETPAQRDAVLARLADLPRFIDTEISNLCPTIFGKHDIVRLDITMDNSLTFRILQSHRYIHSNRSHCLCLKPSLGT